MKKAMTALLGCAANGAGGAVCYVGPGVTARARSSPF
jgi:hypothetical protein